MRSRRVAVCVGVSFLLLLVVGTCTPLLVGILRVLPAHCDLFFHALSHAALVIAVALATRIPTPVIFVASVLLAVCIECIQAVFIAGRTGSVEDVCAASLGSLAILMRPTEVSSQLPI